MVTKKIEQAAKMLEKLEAQIKPGLKVYVWYVRGEFYTNKAGEKFKKEELPDGENVLNIIIEPV
jgi:hypothetical protein